MIVRVLLASRSISLYLVTLLLLAALSWQLGATGILINLEFFRPEVRLPYPEICALLAAALGAVVLRPRFWEWDRVATRRASVVATAAALGGSTAPALVAVAGTLALPPGAPVAWRVSNAIVISALIFTFAPLLGPAIAGALGVATYFLLGLITNLWVDVSLLPLTRPPAHDAHWIAVAVLLTAVAAVHYRSRGATAWSQRMYNRDE